MLSVKQGGIKYHFWVFGMTRLGIEPRFPRPLANTNTLVKYFIKSKNVIKDQNFENWRKYLQRKMVFSQD